MQNYVLYWQNNVSASGKLKKQLEGKPDGDEDTDRISLGSLNRPDNNPTVGRSHPIRLYRSIRPRAGKQEVK